VALFNCWSGWSSRAALASGNVIQRRGGQLNVKIDTRWGEGFGYRPMRITFTPAVPSIADRTITVQCLFRRNSNENLSVEQDVLIPAGSAPVEATVSIPHYISWAEYRFNILEDGEVIKSLCTTWMWDSSTDAEYIEDLPVVLMLGKEKPDTSRLIAPFPEDAYWISPQVAMSTSSTPPFEMPTVQMRDVAELSDRWIDYSSLDVLCMSFSELTQLKQSHPKTFRAVLSWTVAGGNLWVYGLGGDWESSGDWDWQGLKGLDLLLGTEASGWKVPSDTHFDKTFFGGRHQEFTSVGQSDEWKSRQTTSLDELPTDGDAKSRPLGSKGHAHFRLREHGMGMIVALAPEDPFPGTLGEWRWVLNSVGPNRLLWYQRHGVSMVSWNPDYWKFLIPGLGLAPVTEFVLLISLFMLAVGPVNYWLLRRWGRRHLLVVTVPGSAAAVTLLMFVYAMVSDGLGTRLRVRSFTNIDQRTGQAASWARLSYYAGLRPRDGLRFSEDVVVLPLVEVPADSYGHPQSSGELRWDEGQHCRSGWLASRTPTQYLTLRSRATDRGLWISESPGKKDSLRVRNELGTKILQLAICSDGGEYYWTTDVEPDAVATPKPAKQTDIAQRLRAVFRANRPAEPLNLGGWGQGDILDVSYGRSYYGYYGGNRWELTAPTQEDGRMEQSLHGLTTYGGTSSSLAPRTYIAIVERSPEVELGVASAQEEACFHVILGKF